MALFEEREDRLQLDPLPYPWDAMEGRAVAHPQVSGDGQTVDRGLPEDGGVT